MGKRNIYSHRFQNGSSNRGKKNKKQKKSALSQLAHAWLAVWVVLIFRQGKQDGSNRWIRPAPHWPCKSFGEWIFRACSETGAAGELCELGIWFSYSKTEQPSHIPVFYHFLIILSANQFKIFLLFQGRYGPAQKFSVIKRLERKGPAHLSLKENHQDDAKISASKLLNPNKVTIL